MKRRHTMPFGAELAPDGTRFRLWAPAATAVDVEIGEASAPICRAMSRRERGWFETRVDGVRAGARYAFRIDGDYVVPDPASRANPGGVHDASVVVDPHAYEWRDAHWRGMPWREAVVYELHVGTFTPEGSFDAAIGRLDYLVDLGISAIELMPVAAFAGRRNWGYDGVLLFAPAACYGPPEALKRLVDEAHQRGVMVLLDVVYNHFGPEGNYIGRYAPAFFNATVATPWGPAIDFDGDGGADVRAFFVHNALYWIEEFHVDGLRLDAVHAIVDRSTPDIVAEICAAVREAAGTAREIHVVLENDRNEVRYLERDAQGHARLASAQWNDDVHHALHVLATGEADGYYAEFARRPLEHLGRALAEGFAWQGERSAWRDGRPRGGPSARLPAEAFVNFTQTHDQIGNRAFGERLAALAAPEALRAAVACVLLAPAVPLLFMGEEFSASSPFLFFCDFGADLAASVTRGRREEFGRFARFRDAKARAAIPDPNDAATFASSKLDWSEAASGEGGAMIGFYRQLLGIRRRHIVPRLRGMSPGGTFEVRDGRVLRVAWTLGGGAVLRLAVNFAHDAAPAQALGGVPLYTSAAPAELARGFPPYTVACTLDRSS